MSAVDSSIVEACPSKLRSQTRVGAPQQQEVSHAAQPAGDLLHQTGALLKYDSQLT